jgi:serine/threonine protein kinase
MQIASDPLGGWPESVRSQVAAPRAVWTKDGFLWELQDYYEGISLGNLILRNHQSVNGEFLRECTQSLVDVLLALGKTGLIHRDINPFNLFFTYSGKLLLIDWTFCTQLSTQSGAVLTAGYTAPEQQQGNACHASDWYSLAATLFFLSNCEAPPQRGTPGYEEGIRNLDTGGHKLEFARQGGWGSWLSSFCNELLAPDPDERPIPTRIAWQPITLAGDPLQSLRAFDFGPNSHLLVARAHYWILPKDLIALEAMLAALAKKKAGFETPPLVERLMQQYGWSAPS